MHHMQHAHHHLHERDNVATAVKVVYVTATPSFDGPIGGYSTGGVEMPSSSAPAPTMPSVVPASSVETSAVPTSIVAASSQATSQATSLVASSSTSAAASSATSSTLAQSSASPIVNMAAATTPSASAPTASSDSSNSGMSTGAQAGLAIGILALIALIMTGAFLFYRNRKSKQAAEKGEKLDNEKSPFGGNSSAAPRLSLGLNEKAGLAAPVPAVTREAENPFGDHNKLPEAKLPGLDAVAPKEAPRSTSPTENANNVHRVQLDFNPSMDDELELRQGQLVRLLHEYDDGWCLCIRLDRSQQGVVPRSCVSKSAMKPRPAGPPPAQRPQQSNGPRARSNSSAPRPTSPNTAANGAVGPFGEGQYRARSNTVDSKPAGLVSADKLSSSPNNSSPESTSPTLAPARKPVPGQAV